MIEMNIAISANDADFLAPRRKCKIIETKPLARKIARRNTVRSIKNKLG